MTDTLKGDFRSDNVAGVHPSILQAMAQANAGTAAPYGRDESADRLDARYSELFGAKVKVFPVATGTAANTIALTAVVRPYGAVYCHADAHVRIAEGHAVSAFGGGATLVAVDGAAGRMDPDMLDAALRSAPYGNTQKPQPDAVSVTQATEQGTIYDLPGLTKIGEIARRHRLVYHMDGARFANALATLGCSASAMTSAIGLDLLSFGATKNGAMNAEALVVFQERLVEPIAFRLRRAGQTWSKMRYAAAQLLSYVEGDLYLDLARQANARATELGEGLARLPGVTLTAPVQANLVMASLPAPLADGLARLGFAFQRRGPAAARFACRYDQPVEEITALLDAAGELAAAFA